MCGSGRIVRKEMEIVMVKKPTQGGSAPEAAATAAASPRDRVVEALMTLAATQAWEEISISDIARQAGVTLAEFRDLFPSKGAVLGGFSRRIDRIVLEGTSADLTGEPARERLFDVLMRRVDALAPYKAALRNIATAVKRDALTLLALNQVSLNSMRFMLEAAGINAEGPLGTLKLQGAVIAFARTLDSWFDDDDPGLAKTLARLDRELGRGERCLGYAEDLHRLSAPLRSLARAVCAGPAEFRRRRAERTRRHGDVGGDPEDYAPAQAI
jgi:AcrR family transcriptional regulator